MRLAEAVEEARAQALSLGCGALHQRGQLVGVAYESKGSGLQQGRQAGRQGYLACLVHEAHVEGLVAQQRMGHAQRGAPHLQPHAAAASGAQLDGLLHGCMNM